MSFILIAKNLLKEYENGVDMLRMKNQEAFYQNKQC